VAQPQREDDDRAAFQHAPTRQVIVGPIRLGGTTLGRHRHICAFFNSHDDHYRVLLPFIEDGFDSGDKAVHIIDPRRRADHIRRLSTIGIDATAAQDDGRLDLRDWSDAHLRDGLFNQDRTLHLIDGIRQRSAEDGFPRIRFVTHMEWALEDPSAVEGLLEYEARANLVPCEDPVVCAYDLSKFGGDVVVDVMRTHPLILIGGILQENPFFVPPDEFLRELRARRGR
jgi:hypothetical protein